MYGQEFVADRNFQDDPELFMQPGKGDEKLFAMFYNHFTIDQAKTNEAGRPIYQDAVFVRILTPGDRTNVVDRPMRQEDEFRFPKAWGVFKKHAEAGAEGTRMEEWPLLSRSQCEELKYFGFRTVEHIAEANEQACQRMPGLRGLSARAQAWLAKAKEGEILAKAQAEKEQMQGKIDSLEAQLAEVLKRLPVSGVDAATIKHDSTKK